MVDTRSGRFHRFVLRVDDREAEARLPDSCQQIRRARQTSKMVSHFHQGEVASLLAVRGSDLGKILWFGDRAEEPPAQALRQLPVAIPEGEKTAAVQQAGEGIGHGGCTGGGKL